MKMKDRGCQKPRVCVFSVQTSTLSPNPSSFSFIWTAWNSFFLHRFTLSKKKKLWWLQVLSKARGCGHPHPYSTITNLHTCKIVGVVEFCMTLPRVCCAMDKWERGSVLVSPCTWTRVRIEEARCSSGATRVDGPGLRDSNQHYWPSKTRHESDSTPTWIEHQYEHQYICV